MNEKQRSNNMKVLLINNKIKVTALVYLWEAALSFTSNIFMVTQTSIPKYFTCC